MPKTFYKELCMKKSTESLPKKAAKTKTKGFSVINPYSAGIDIGSREHYVAVPKEKCSDNVRKFKCYTPDLYEMAKWLKKCGIKTVAMESTGVYWIPVYQILEDYGFEVKLVNARHVKNVPGRKTDVQDCQWLQQLHSFGLLNGAFRPDRSISEFRSYWRHRCTLVNSGSQQILRMQKALEQMNIQLHKTISDINGVSGMKIITAIVNGERNPEKLAGLCHYGIKADKETLVKSLTGDYREEHIFSLKQSLELYNVFQEKIRECDLKTAELLSRFEQQADPNELKKSGKRIRSNRKSEPELDLSKSLFAMTGVDLTQIDGISTLTANTIVAECGFKMDKFQTEKHFASWLGLCPNNRITGGKIQKSGTKKVVNRAAIAFRIAASTLKCSKSALGAYYRRMKARLGPAKAVTATAHKLAKIVYRMLKFGQEYIDAGQDQYEKKYKERLLFSLKKRAKAFGYELLPTAQCAVVS
jgi:transposase